MRRRLFREYVFKLVVTVAVTTTVAIFALIGKIWTWPNAIVGSVLLICGVLHLMDRFGIGQSNKSRVRDWLDSSGYSIRTISDSNEFHFVMIDSIGMTTSILRQSTDDAPVEIVSARHEATPAQLATYNAMTPTEQEHFWKTVRLELLRYGIGFSDLKLDRGGVAFSERLSIDGTLTGVEFLRRVLFVRSGARLYWELLAQLNPPA